MNLQPGIEMDPDRTRWIFVALALLFFLILVAATVSANSGENALAALSGA